MCNKKLSENDFKRFSYLSHIPNCHKIDEEFEKYWQFAKRLGLPNPDRNSKIRPLYEK